MIRLANEKDSINVVFDQVGTPTYAHDLAQAILDIIIKTSSGSHNFSKLRGIYHFSNEGVASWYDFALAVFEISGKTVKVKPVLSNEFITPAMRPSFSVLNKTKIKQSFGIEIPYWKESLKECIKRLKN